MCIKLDREKHRQLRLLNKRLYGITMTPQQQVMAKERYIKNKIINLKLYGTATNPRHLDTSRQRRTCLRSIAINLYGGACVCCGENRISKLTFDHIVISSNKMSSFPLVRDALVIAEQLGVPNNRYRLLCWNCNNSLFKYGYCLHNPLIIKRNDYQIKSSPSATYGRELDKRIKMEMVHAYGDVCQICGESHLEFLTIDHINGNGNQHRKSIGVAKSGSKFYRWLKSKGWPRDEYRLLCYNCNCPQEVELL